MKKIIRFVLLLGLVYLIVQGLKLGTKEGSFELALNLDGSILRKEGSIYEIYGDQVVYFEEGLLKLRGINGEEPKTLMLNVQDPIIVPSQTCLYVGNREDGEIYIINDKLEVVERVPLNKPLYNLKESAGSLIYHIKEEDMESIGIINPKGQQVIRNNFEERIVVYEINSKNDRLATLSLRDSEDIVDTHIEISDFKNPPRTQNIGGEIGFKLGFNNREDIIILTDEGVYYLDKKEFRWYKTLGTVKDMALDSRNIYILKEGQIQLLDLGGQEISTLDLDFSPEELRLFGDKYLLVNNKDELRILDKRGRLVLETNMGYIEDLKIVRDKIYILDHEKLGSYSLGRMENNKKEDVVGDDGKLNDRNEGLLNRFGEKFKFFNKNS